MVCHRGYGVEQDRKWDHDSSSKRFCSWHHLETCALFRLYGQVTSIPKKTVECWANTAYFRGIEVTSWMHLNFCTGATHHSKMMLNLTQDVNIIAPSTFRTSQAFLSHPGGSFQSPKLGNLIHQRKKRMVMLVWSVNNAVEYDYYYWCWWLCWWWDMMIMLTIVMMSMLMMNMLMMVDIDEWWWWRWWYSLMEDEASLKDIHSDCDFLGDYTYV